MSTCPKAEAPLAPTTSSAQEEIASLETWTKPVLTVYGDVRQLTMGPTPGTGESGQPTILRP